LTSVIADYHFAPTERARLHLLKEGVSEGKVFVTGNTVIDALYRVLRRQAIPGNERKMESYFNEVFGLSTYGQRIILVTAHRRESFGTGFENICEALKEIALKNGMSGLSILSISIQMFGNLSAASLERWKGFTWWSPLIMNLLSTS